MYIDCIAYMDYSVYLYKNIAQFIFIIFRKIPCLKSILYNFDPTKNFLLLNSKYFDDLEKRELAMSFPEDKIDSYWSKNFNVFGLNWVSDYDRSNGIITEARQILLDVKKLEIEKRLAERKEQTVVKLNNKFKGFMKNVENQLGEIRSGQK